MVGKHDTTLGGPNFFFPFVIDEPQYVRQLKLFLLLDVIDGEPDRVGEDRLIENTHKWK